MADFTSASAQARELRQILQRRHLATSEEQRQLYRAYSWLAHESYGQELLAHWAMLAYRPGVASAEHLYRIAEKQPIQAQIMAATREQELWMAEGMRRLVQTMFDMIAAAPAMLAGDLHAS